MKYGFIGLGNMASAIIEGMAASGEFEKDEIYGYNRSEGKTKVLSEKTGLIPCGSEAEVAETAEILVLAVKPQMMADVLVKIGNKIKEEQSVISIAAGLSTEWYEERLSENVPVVRVMPNINAKVKAAVTAVCAGKNASEKDLQAAEKIFGTVGETYRIEEKMFSAFMSIGGASGAFVFLYIDALANAGVRAGLPRNFAVELATETVIGSGELLKKTGEHPIALMNQVCSPAGTTIEGVMTLQRLGFESAVQEAIKAIIQKDEMIQKG